MKKYGNARPDPITVEKQNDFLLYPLIPSFSRREKELAFELMGQQCVSLYPGYLVVGDTTSFHN